MSGSPVVVAVVPVYAPPDALAPRLVALATQVRAVVVVVDGVGSVSVDVPTVEVIAHARNRGIAAALNTGIERARALGATHVLTVDQDSDLPADHVQRALRVFATADSTRLGAVVVDAFNGIPSIPTWTSPEGIGLVPEALQTGMLIDVDCIDVAGGFEEDLVIDVVDTEFCHRIRRAGWSIGIATGSDVRHELGELVPMRLLGIPWRRDGRIRRYEWHRPFRQYYIVRNNLVVTDRFRDVEPEWSAATRVRVRHEAIRVAVVGPQGLRHAIASIAGWWHGRRGRLGPIPTSLARWLRT